MAGDHADGGVSTHPIRNLHATLRTKNQEHAPGVIQASSCHVARREAVGTLGVARVGSSRSAPQVGGHVGDRDDSSGPRTCTDSAATRQPTWVATSDGLPCRVAATYPAAKMSPAPSGSSSCTAGAATCRGPGRSGHHRAGGALLAHHYDAAVEYGGVLEAEHLQLALRGETRGTGRGTTARPRPRSA